MPLFRNDIEAALILNFSNLTILSKTGPGSGSCVILSQSFKFCRLLTRLTLVRLNRSSSVAYPEILRDLSSKWVRFSAERTTEKKSGDLSGQLGNRGPYKARYIY